MHTHQSEAPVHHQEIVAEVEELAQVETYEHSFTFRVFDGDEPFDRTPAAFGISYLKRILGEDRAQ
jgi:hypothetical protein